MDHGISRWVAENLFKNCFFALWERWAKIQSCEKIVEYVFTSYFPELWLCEGKHLLGGSVRECHSLPGDIAHGPWICAGFRSIQGDLTQAPSFSLILPHNFCPLPSILQHYWLHIGELWVHLEQWIWGSLQLAGPSAPEPEGTMWIWNLTKKNNPIYLNPSFNSEGQITTC